MSQWLILLLVAVTVLLFWAVLLTGLGRISGWHELSRHYPLETPFVGTEFRFRSAQIGWINISGAVMFGVNAEGLQLDVFSLFTYGHPTIVIPWGDISVTQTSGTFTNYFDLHFARVPHTRVRILASLGKQIADAANQNWPH